MEQFLQQLAASMLVLFVVFAGPFAALYLLTRRKRAIREARRSPLTTELLRPPGHALREKLEELRVDFAFDVSLLMVIPTALLALYALSLYARGTLPAAWVSVLFGVCMLAFVAYWIRQLLRKSEDIDKTRMGFDAELAVGQELDQLMRRGAAVFHDLPGEHFNIDHVLISMQGVFAIETKGRSKPSHIPGRAGATVVFDGASLAFPEATTRAPIEQAQRQAQWLGKWLTSATGEPVTVMPVVALPGWFVDRRGSGPVRVVSGREVACLLDKRAAVRLTCEQMQRVVHQVEQRCRNVEPTYRPDETAS